MRAESGKADVSDRFIAHRSRLLSVAYRLTGSVSDAEDCVQEAWIRWQSSSRDDVENDEAFLVRIVSRLALDRLASAPRRRENYVGPWLPEPLVMSIDGSRDEPADAAVVADEVTFALMVILDRLSPDERASLVLHDVFGVSFEEVASLLDRTSDSVRQLASRARRRVRDDPDAPRPVPPTDAEAMSRLLMAFNSGDVATVAALFADDVTLTSDGGAERHAARNVVVGPERVARLMVNIGKRDMPSASNIQMVESCGSPAIWMELPDGPLVMMFDFDEAGAVRRVWTQLNPEKTRLDPWSSA